MSDVQSTERTEALAHLKFARVAPRKLRRVADAIRGKSVREALVLLKFSGVFAAEPIEKLLRSAVANAENNYSMATDELYVVKIIVDSGPGGGFTKRLDPRAQGRAAFKRKRMSHVTIVVSTTAPKRPPKRRAGASIALSTKSTRRAAVESAKSAKPAKPVKPAKPAKRPPKKTAAKAGAKK